MKSTQAILRLGFALALLLMSGCSSPVLFRTEAPTLVPGPLPTPSPAIRTPQTLSLCQANGPEVYLVVGTERRHIVDWDSFLTLGFKQEQIRACGTNVTYAEGQPLTRLLKASGDEIYWIENGSRRHIPDLITFRALGFRDQDISLVSDELLATWAVGPPIPSTQALSPTPSGPSVPSLRDALRTIHDQFKIDPSKGCFDLLSPYPEYQRGLQKMTALLLNDPRAQSLSFAQRQALFAQVAGFDGVRLFAGSPTATLVSLRTNRGYSLGCGSHYQSPDALFVVDQQNSIYDVGTEGLVKQAWWVNDRWVALVQLKLDSSSGPTRWGLWQVARTDASWQRVLDFEFVPTPYNFGTPPPIRFESGYQSMIADLDYWWADDPCDFNATFKSTYSHGDWQMRRTYRLTNDTYTQVSAEVLNFRVQRKDTGEQTALDWKGFCVGAVR